MFVNKWTFGVKGQLLATATFCVNSSFFVDFVIYANDTLSKNRRQFSGPLSGACVIGISSYRRPKAWGRCNSNTPVATIKKLATDRVVQRQVLTTTVGHGETVFSERELTFTFAICYRPSVCRLSSATFVRPTQAVQIFCNISTALLPWPSIDIHWKFRGDHPRGTPPPGELNTRGVATYSDFGPIDSYISETVQDGR